MADVFISYSSKEQKQVDTLVAVLEKNGVKCWISTRDVPKGASHAEVIPGKIKECRFFLLAVTQNAIDSEQVKSEIDIAFDEKKVIIPFMLKNVPDGRFNYYLRGKQKIFAYKGMDDAIQQLLSTVRKSTWNGTRRYIKCPRCSETRLKVGGMRFSEYVMLGLFALGGASYLIILIMMNFPESGIANYLDEIVRILFGEEISLWEAIFLGLFPLILMAPHFLTDQINQQKNELELHFRCVHCNTKFTARVPYEYKLEDIVEFPQ